MIVLNFESENNNRYLIENGVEIDRTEAIATDRNYFLYFRSSETNICKFVSGASYLRAGTTEFKVYSISERTPFYDHRVQFIHNFSMSMRGRGYIDCRVEPLVDDRYAISLITFKEIFGGVADVTLIKCSEPEFSAREACQGRYSLEALNNGN